MSRVKATFLANFKVIVNISKVSESGGEAFLHFFESLWLWERRFSGVHAEALGHGGWGRPKFRIWNAGFWIWLGNSDD